MVKSWFVFKNNCSDGHQVWLEKLDLRATHELPRCSLLACPQVSLDYLAIENSLKLHYVHFQFIVIHQLTTPQKS